MKTHFPDKEICGEILVNMDQRSKRSLGNGHSLLSVTPFLSIAYSYLRRKAWRTKAIVLSRDGWEVKGGN